MATPSHGLNAVIVIPARLASSRLPDKPLADIGGLPMIVRVWQQAMEADIGPVVVACAEAEIADVITAAGGIAVLTDPDHESGSDRIFEALQAFDAAGQYDVVINLQGDLPLIDPEVIKTVVQPLADPEVDIATLAAEIVDEDEKHNPNVVKAIVDGDGETIAQAETFTRETPTDDGPMWHHIGIYGYRRAALARFVALPPSASERAARLEQLRALDDGMRIDVAFVDTVPFGVDTPADLERARALVAL